MEMQSGGAVRNAISRERSAGVPASSIRFARLNREGVTEFVTGTGGTMLGEWAWDKWGKGGPPPQQGGAEFNMTRLNSLNTASSLEVDTRAGDLNLSGRAIANSKVRGDYDNYLLEKRAEEVAKINKDYVEGASAAMALKIGMWTAIGGMAINSALGAASNWWSNKKQEWAMGDYKAAGGGAAYETTNADVQSKNSAFQNPELIAGGEMTQAEYRAEMAKGAHGRTGTYNPYTGQRGKSMIVNESFGASASGIAQIQENYPSTIKSSETPAGTKYPHSISKGNIWVNPKEYNAAKKAGSGHNFNVRVYTFPESISTYDQVRSRTSTFSPTFSEMASKYGTPAAEDIVIEANAAGGSIKKTKSEQISDHVIKSKVRAAKRENPLLSSLKFERGGAVPSMLTNGEFVFSKNSAESIGPEALTRINQFADGGHVFGRGGIDNVGPVMLQEGEFVVRAESARKMESRQPGILSLLNEKPRVARGLLGYHDGGVVGNSTPLTMTTEDIEKAPRASSTPEVKGGSGEVTNNINISVNVAKDGSATVTEDAGGEGDYSQAKGLSEKIKSSVLDVIIQEKRIGGSLYF